MDVVFSSGFDIAKNIKEKKEEAVVSIHPHPPQLNPSPPSLEMDEKTSKKKK